MRQNGISIENVMNMECMDKSKLIAGFKGVTNTVSKVNIMADPDVLDWVSEGELLLTTGYFFKKDNIEEQKELIKECSRKGLAGIGIKIYPYLETLPHAIIELANKLNFPIIELFYTVPFSDIMTPVFRAIFNKQVHLLQRLEKIHEELMNAMLSGENINKISDIIYKNLQNPIYIKLEFPDLIIEQFKDIDDSTKNALLKNVNEFYNVKSLIKKEKKLDESLQFIGNKNLKRMVVPIVVNGGVYGHIFAWAVNGPIGGFDLSILENATATISLEILKKLSVKEVENKYKSEFLQDLISLDEKRREEAIKSAQMFNLKVDKNYVVIVINLKKNNNERSNKSIDFINKNISKCIQVVEKIIKNLNIEGLIVSKTDGIDVLVSFDNNYKGRQLVSKLKNEMEVLMSKEFDFIPYDIGIGRYYRGLEMIYKSYIDAIKAIKAGNILNEDKVIDFERLGIYKILCQDDLHEELMRFYDTSIKPLYEYDLKKSSELIKTLEAYFIFSGNIKKIADYLYTHYNTILYRINRIEKITNMSLKDYNDRLSLEIGLKIKMLLVK